MNVRLARQKGRILLENIIHISIKVRQGEGNIFVNTDADIPVHVDMFLWQLGMDQQAVPCNYSFLCSTGTLDS